MRARSMGRKKALAILLMACMIVNLLTGCSGGRSAKKESIDYHVELETPPEPTDKLVIYQPPDMDEIIGFALSIFKVNFPDVEVEVREFGHYTDDPLTRYNNMENYRATLSSELMAGQGPDVVFWYNSPFDYLYGSEFKDIYKVMDSGAFYNLDNFLVNDPDFRMDDFSENVLDIGVYKGERQFMPLSYGMDVFLTSEECMDKNNVTLSQRPTYEEFSEQTIQFCTTNDTNYDKWLFFSRKKIMDYIIYTLIMD